MGKGLSLILDCHLSVYVCMYMYIYIYMYVYIYIYIYICVCVCVCVFIYLCFYFMCDFVFSRNKGSVSVMSSVGKLVCYHLGSVAKGSFIITIFKLPRLILTYIDRK